MFKPLPQMPKPCLFSMQAYIAGPEYKGPQQKPPASTAKACQAVQAQAAAPSTLKTPFQQHAHKDFARLVQPTIHGMNCISHARVRGVRHDVHAQSDLNTQPPRYVKLPTRF